MRAFLIACLALTGCATDKAYYDAIDARTRAEQTIAVAKAEADKARYAAIATLGNSGGDAAKVAAMFSLMQQGSTPTQAPAQPIAPAPSPVDRVLQVLQLTNSIVTPWIAPVMAYKQGQTNANVSIAQANANRDIFLGSYNALAQVAANIPQPTTTTNTTTTTTNANQSTSNANQTTSNANQTTTNSLGRDGVIGSGVLTRTCAAGSGGLGAAGAAGGSSAASPAIAASGVSGTSSAIGGVGGAGAPGGAGGALNC